MTAKSRDHDASPEPAANGAQVSSRYADQVDVLTNGLLEAARLIDAAADDIEWTVTDSKDLAGMRKAAQLLRIHAQASDRDGARARSM